MSRSTFQGNAIKAAFENSKKLRSQTPEVFHVHALEVFDYDTFYAPYLNKTLQYYSKPHQFRFQKFNDVVLILCHYKLWAAEADYLPLHILLPVYLLPNLLTYLPHPNKKLSEPQQEVLVKQRLRNESWKSLEKQPQKLFLFWILQKNLRT